ncbi:MAG: hypothetical protein C0412_20095 [Flavobacterium sp.]|nr:hypothetical protein [Flavobacterium sp.]
MQDTRFIELTTKFLSKEITEEEKNELTILLQLENYNKQFETVVQNWNNEKRVSPEFKVNEGIEILSNKLTARDASFYWGENIGVQKYWYQSTTLLKVAASVVFLLMVSTWLFYSGVLEKAKPVIAWDEKVTVAGQKYLVELGDNSKITLNAGSKIKYPHKFIGSSREVFLEGEAYFEIARDVSHPFIVHSGKLATTVLGTKFNVSAFPAEKNIIVSLIEGSVKVSKESSEAVEGIALLQPKQQLFYNKGESISSFHNFESQEVIGWKDNVLIFKKELFSNVLVKLERNFGIKFEVADKSFNNKKITANFQNESFWTVSETIKKLTGLNYKAVKENNRITKIVFYKK